MQPIPQYSWTRGKKLKEPLPVPRERQSSPTQKPSPKKPLPAGVGGQGSKKSSASTPTVKGAPSTKSKSKSSPYVATPSSDMKSSTISKKPKPRNPPLASSSTSSFNGSTCKKTLGKGQGDSLRLSRRGECEICKQSCRSHCAGCKRVFYCCKQHQQMHWAQHKPVCRPYSIPTQYSVGLHSRSSCVTPEMQFMISTKQINPGHVIFTEKPLLVAANDSSDKRLEPFRCCCCLLPAADKDNCLNNKDTSLPRALLLLQPCAGCSLPLCEGCCNSNKSKTGGFLPGQGHSQEECNFISSLRQKGPEFQSLGNGDRRTLLKDLTVLRILLFRTTCPWRWESLMALRNSPRFIACCKHNYGGVEKLDEANYTVSSYYLKNIKEKNVSLLEIAKLVTVFSEVSQCDPSLVVLYENLSWVCHACTPNAEKFCPPTAGGDRNFEVMVKAVGPIGECDKITMSFFNENEEGGRATLAQKLFQSKGAFCSQNNCPCHQRGFDVTVGIRCDLIDIDSPSQEKMKLCPGILAPVVDSPDPDKGNLGLGIFCKGKKWECCKCNRVERYDKIHPKIIVTIQELSSCIDKCCKEDLIKSPQAFMKLQHKIVTILSENHWLLEKAKNRALGKWNEIHGHGAAILRKIVGAPPIGPPSQSIKNNHISVMKQKMDIYGSGIYVDLSSLLKKKKKVAGNGMKVNGDLLESMAMKHGEVSPKLGEVLWDAFYSNFVIFMEEFRKDLPLPQKSKQVEIAVRNGRKLTNLMELCEKSLGCFRMYEGTTEIQTTSSRTKVHYGNLVKIATEIFEILRKVSYASSSKILSELVTLSEGYHILDTKFIDTAILPSRSKLEVPNEIQFEIDWNNTGPFAFKFGSNTSTSTNSSRSNCSSFRQSKPTFGTGRATFGKNPSHSFPFKSKSTSSGQSSRFFASSVFGSEDEEDYEDEKTKNPFSYTSYASFKKSATSGSNGGTSTGGGGIGSGEFTKEDWSSYFSLSSSESSAGEEEDVLDTDFESRYFGSASSRSRPNFGEDLFNDNELEELAEWASLQFMLNQMKL